MLGMRLLPQEGAEIGVREDDGFGGFGAARFMSADAGRFSGLGIRRLGLAIGVATQNSWST